MEEVWKPIVIEKNGVVYNYEGLYEVSNMGRVRSLGNNRTRKEKILKCKPHKSGYVYVGLHKDGEKQQFYIHRLVATAFIPNPENMPLVNHKNETKTENVWTNLEWCDAKYNVNYGTSRKRASEKQKGKQRKPFSEEHKQKLSEAFSGEKNPIYGRKGEDAPNTKKVLCLETKQVFVSIKEAQLWLGKGDIAQCVRGKSKTAGGYHWMYMDDYKKDLRMQSDVRNSRLVA